MVDYTNASGAVVDAQGRRQFVDRNDALGIQGTYLDADDRNQDRNTLVASVKASGQVPDAKNDDQLTLAIQALGNIRLWSKALSDAVGGYWFGAVVLDANGAYWKSTANANTTVPGADGATWQSLFNGYATQAWAEGQFLQLNEESKQTIIGPVAGPMATARDQLPQFIQNYDFAELKNITNGMVLTDEDFGRFLQTDTMDGVAIAVGMPEASNTNRGRVLAIQNYGIADLTLNANNFNSSYGTGVATIVLPPGATAVFVSDGASYNAIGGSASGGQSPVPSNINRIGQWRSIGLTQNGANSYGITPPGGTWAYYCYNNADWAAGVAAGGANVLGPFTQGNFGGFCWRIA